MGACGGGPGRTRAGSWRHLGDGPRGARARAGTRALRSKAFTKALEQGSYVDVKADVNLESLYKA